MPGLFDINDGDRPSRFELSRYATGELTDEERAALESRLDDGARAHLAEVEAARSAVPGFDLGALRARANAVPDDHERTAQADGATTPRAANNWRWFAPILVLAAVMVLAVLPDPTPVVGPPQPTIGIKGGGLLVYQLHPDENQLRPYQGNALGEGDSVGFRVNALDHGTVAVLSVDGRGTVSVLYPADGEGPVQLGGSGETVALPGTIILDDAPGPEIFVAVFDTPTADARDAVEEAYQQGGAQAVLRWADASADADAVAVERR